MAEEDHVAAWLATGEPLDDTTACIIASWWHGGSKSGLYSFVSTGNVSPQALAEVENEIRSARKCQQQLDEIPALEALARYLRARGGVPGARGGSDRKRQRAWPAGRPIW